LPQVRLRNSGRLFNVTEAQDLSTSEAVVTAMVLLAQRKSFKEAVVDRFDGLVLIGPDGNWHFASALCGYWGTSPAATAEILEIFGFGKKDSIFQSIYSGDDHATFSFTK